MAQLLEGLAQEAIASLQRVVEPMPWHGGYAWWLAAAYRQASDQARSQELEPTLTKSHGQTYLAAFYYAATGEVDAMFDALDASYRRRGAILSILRASRSRVDPRFQSLLAKMNLT